MIKKITKQKYRFCIIFSSKNSNKADKSKKHVNLYADCNIHNLKPFLFGTSSKLYFRIEKEAMTTA